MSKIIVPLIVLLFCLNCNADSELDLTINVGESGVVSGKVEIDRKKTVQSNDFDFQFFLMPFDKVKGWTSSKGVDVFLIEDGKNYSLFLAMFPLGMKKVRVNFHKLFKIEIPAKSEAKLQLDFSYLNLSGKANNIIKSKKFELISELKVFFEEKYDQSELSYDPGKVELINKTGQSKTLFLGSHTPFNKKISIVFPNPYQKSQRTTGVILTIGAFFFALIASLSVVNEIKKNKFWLTISFAFSLLLILYFAYYYYSDFYDSGYLEVIIGAALNALLWIFVYIGEISIVKTYLDKIKSNYFNQEQIE